MHRAVLTSLALAALIHAAPITEPTKTTETSVGDATVDGIIIPKPTFILLPPITGPIKPSDKRDTEVKERQFTWGDPSTWWGVGGDKPTPTGDTTIGEPISGGINPSNKRQTIIGGGDARKEHITALELEYETLLHTFGTDGPWPIKQRLRAIESELSKKYGIKIVKSPDGTTTTFTPGKRDFTFPGGPIPGGPLKPEHPIPGGPMEPSD
ncbi:hypothetical protein F4808DRAFT_223319 [Astrocystis sublimbata]|nr:hypothetical protein F4808DRAFT_223319 [Astrocystis sublimbata]